MERQAESLSPGSRLGEAFLHLLTPQGIYTLMGCGAGLLLIGMIGWLWGAGMLANPIIGASLLGSMNLGLIALGVVLLRCSHYKMAGRGLTHLACFALPLNLWFYDAQGLITLSAGGHLWIPALGCCLIYASLAWLLRDHRHVYTLVSGIALSGLLFLADRSVLHIWEILGPSSLLIILGAFCLFCERLFPERGDFTRSTFGRAFFISGQAGIGSGLSLLVLARIYAWLESGPFAVISYWPTSVIFSDFHQQSMAVGLSLLAAGAYCYSYAISGYGHRYLFGAVVSAICSLLSISDLIEHPQIELTLFGFSVTAIACHVVPRFLSQHISTRKESDRYEFDLPNYLVSVRNAATLAGLALAYLITWWNVALPLLRLQSHLETSWLFFAALGGLIGVCFARRFDASPESRHARLARGDIATGLSLLAIASLQLIVPGGTFYYIGFLGAILLGSSLLQVSLPRTWKPTLLSHLDALAMLMSPFAFAAGLGLIEQPISATPIGNALLLTLFFSGAASISYTQLDRNDETSFARRLIWTTVLATLALAQLLPFWLPSGVSQLLGLTTGGVLLRFLSYLEASTGRSASTSVPIKVSHAVVAVAAAGGMLLVLGELLIGQSSLAATSLLAGQAAASLAVGQMGLSKDTNHYYRSQFAIQMTLALVSLLTFIDLDGMQKAELFTAAFGAILLLAGHVSRFSKWDQRSPNSTGQLSLSFGSLLTATSLLLGLFVERFSLAVMETWWGTFHEVGVLCIGLLLIGTGIIGRIRVTTLAGAAMLGGYIFSLPVLLDLPERLQSTSVYLMIGGGTFFLIAILLSLFRDRLATLPKRVREGSGIFAVLNWK